MSVHPFPGAHSSQGHVPQKPAMAGPSGAGGATDFSGPSARGGAVGAAFGGGGLGVGAFDAAGNSAMYSAPVAAVNEAAQPVLATPTGSAPVRAIKWAAAKVPTWGWVVLGGIVVWSAYRYGAGKSIVPFRKKNSAKKPQRVTISAVDED